MPGAVVVADWLAGWTDGVVVVPPAPTVPHVGFLLPDWGMEYLLADMEEDLERSRGEIPQRPSLWRPAPSPGDFGQIILRRRMLNDEDDD